MSTESNHPIISPRHLPDEAQDLNGLDPLSCMPDSWTVELELSWLTC